MKWTMTFKDIEQFILITEHVVIYWKLDNYLQFYSKCNVFDPKWPHTHTRKHIQTFLGHHWQRIGNNNNNKLIRDCSKQWKYISALAINAWIFPLRTVFAITNKPNNRNFHRKMHMQLCVLSACLWSGGNETKILHGQNQMPF